MSETLPALCRDCLRTGPTRAGAASPRRCPACGPPPLGAHAALNARA
ncbi:MAG TPA: hypothetical protein PKA17_03840, partial [Phenylobacterium sp.]|nr:hypothetical protein [Phenylobacterium sp.]